jgi:hypothetical protein
MSKSKSKDPVTLLEVILTESNTFEIRMGKINTATIPVVVGLLEKVKFDLLIREYDEVEEKDELPVNFINQKFDA